VKAPLRDGQVVRHARFGLGTTVHSNERRTTVDFEDHGKKTFVTSMLEVEPANERPSRRPARRKASSG
jgi:hypothetical protein